MGLQRLQIFSLSNGNGFTIIELVVVVLILSVIAGTVISAFGPEFIGEKQDTATRYEMTQIRDAILKFSRDNPIHVLSDANLCSPADASFLLSNEFDNDDDCEFGENTGTPDPDEFAAWDPDYNLGWNGPYLTRTANDTATISGQFEFNGSIGSGTDSTGVPVIRDAYDNGGNPYFFFNLDGDEARIVSFGENGTYDSEATTCADALTNSESTDDIVLCLR